MKRTATDLRAHLYEVLDQVARTGEAVYVTRHGIDLCITRAAPKPQPAKAPRSLPNLIVGDPDDLIHVEWPWGDGESR